jgi:hypothetical protein
MGMAVVARYASLSEAFVVQSALHSAGIRAEVFDNNRGSMIWTEQLLLGGFRIAVPGHELEDAVAILRDVTPQAERIEAPGWTWAAIGLAVICGFTTPLPWMWVALRQRPAPWKVAGVVAILAMIALCLAVVFWETGRHSS